MEKNQSVSTAQLNHHSHQGHLSSIPSTVTLKDGDLNKNQTQAVVETAILKKLRAESQKAKKHQDYLSARFFKLKDSLVHTVVSNN
ncbi:hypothetical protein FGO68_gene3743 [Halteria grandinella]|uniref:Uncharacterized protein n=1 Tax=Halteria grandinella TaxID=5974 RepID=A0A8J8SWB6_HALGN|nr:hypothetical protein FGO68_gene3743 [Halteria grandinella]